MAHKCRSQLFWELPLNGAVAKLALPYQYTQWYYPELGAGKHFIDVPNATDVSRLAEQALRDNAALYRVAKVRAAPVVGITYELAQKFTAGVLRSVLALWRDKPSYASAAATSA